MFLWCSTTATFFSGAPCWPQRCRAADQRAAKSCARAWYWAALAGSSVASRAASGCTRRAMFRGSNWMCGLPAACTSPSARSTRAGTSRRSTSRPSSMKPGWPGATLALPDWRSSTGSQPASSSRPVHSTRSALRARAIRLGRASMRCGSCWAVVALLALTRSPPSSVASAAHSGSQASTLRAAWAGPAARLSRAAYRGVRRVVRMRFIGGLLKRMRAVRAQAHDVLQKPLPVAAARARAVQRELQA